jgi:hypothetical protein
MSDWAQLTVSDGHLLDEITAALRDAGIELRLVDPVEPGPRGARTRFGVRVAAAKVIEVPRERLAEARALLDEIFADAEAAVMREAGVAAQTAAERDEEAAWRVEMARKRARTWARFKWGALILVAAMVLAIVYAVVVVR